MCGWHVAINVHGNYNYMVEGSPHMWQLTCTVITTIWWRGALTCGSHVAINMQSNYYYGGGEPSHVAINVHSNYYYMVEGTPHVWAINVHSNY